MQQGIAIAFSLALVGAGAPGQDHPPSDPRLPTWEQSHLVEGNQIARTLRAFAYCAARVRADAAEALVASIPGSAEEQRASAALTAGDNHPCLYQARRMVIRSGPLLRGIVAEFLYGRDHPRRQRHVPRPLDPPAPLSAPEWRDIPDSALARWIASCAVHRAPDQAEALLRFNHDSPGETRTLRSLRPVLLDCLPPGRSLRISRLSIRAMLAEALYRFSREN